MSRQKILFIDRDGTLIIEPTDKQIDSFEKLQLVSGVIPALLSLQKLGYEFVMVTNQDGLGSAQFSWEKFQGPHQLMLDIFKTQGIIFRDILICPHFSEDNCHCRKPKTGLLQYYIKNEGFDKNHSYVIGDRSTDMELAHNLGIAGIQFDYGKTWQHIVTELTYPVRSGVIRRTTRETQVEVQVNLDKTEPILIDTGLGFFNHMLEQLAKHGGFSLQIQMRGDLHIDEHHTVEDTAIALGQALKIALGEKRGIQRYGFLLPMDESIAHIAIDLSGRDFLVFDAKFTREKVGDLPTELVSHFFHSFADNLEATLHVKVVGENNHHMIESIFKGVGRALQMAILKKGDELPSTKGVL